MRCKMRFLNCTRKLAHNDDSIIIKSMHYFLLPAANCFQRLHFILSLHGFHLKWRICLCSATVISHTIFTLVVQYTHCAIASARQTKRKASNVAAQAALEQVASLRSHFSLDRMDSVNGLLNNSALVLLHSSFFSSLWDFDSKCDYFWFLCDRLVCSFWCCEWLDGKSDDHWFIYYWVQYFTCVLWKTTKTK